MAVFTFMVKNISEIIQWWPCPGVMIHIQHIINHGCFIFKCRKLEIGSFLFDICNELCLENKKERSCRCFYFACGNKSMFYGKPKRLIAQLINHKNNMNKCSPSFSLVVFRNFWPSQERTRKNWDTQWQSVGHKAAGASAKAASQTD